MTTTGDEAYHLYCNSRFGDLNSLSELERKSEASTAETVVSGAALVWLGYYAKALFYFHGNEEYDTKEGKEKAITLYTTILPALKAAVAVEEEDESAPHLQYLLGWYYHGTLGFGQENDKACHLFRLAANQGLAIAQSNLGLCYALGMGVPQDKAEAIRWYRLAANKGHAPAQYNLGIQCIQETPPNYSRAIPYFRQAADQCFTSAQYMLGVMYCNGEGVNRDADMGCEFLQMAVTKGYAAAQHMLALCYQNGNGVPLSYEDALRLFVLAAEQGLAQSQFAAGVYHEHGIGLINEENAHIDPFIFHSLAALVWLVWRAVCHPQLAHSLYRYTTKVCI